MESLWGPLHREENVRDRVITDPDGLVSKWGVFCYIYAILNHPDYRERYAENLKRELPRIPLVNDREAFWVLVHVGERLIELHVHYEEQPEWPLCRRINPAVPLSYRVEQMKLSRDRRALRVNESLTLEDIPPRCFAYQLGGKSALEWVIDQYHVTTLENGYVSDPNQEDDPEYIVRLVGQVVYVSMETVRLLARLRQKVRPEMWCGVEHLENVFEESHAPN